MVSSTEKSQEKAQRKGCEVFALTATTCFVYPSLTACARAYGVARSRIVELISTGATHTDGITTFDVPVDSTLDFEAYRLAFHEEP